LFVHEVTIMREGVSNAGKKEQRQINQVLEKEVKEGRRQREAESRTVPKGRRTRDQKTK
jgi:hypothetical protein